MLLQILLSSNRALALQLNDRLVIRVVHNAPLLLEWRDRDDAMPGSLRQLLEELLPQPASALVMDQIGSAAAGADQSGTDLGTYALRIPHGGGPDRYLALSLHRDPESEELPLMLVLRDVTALEGQHHALTQARESLDTAVAVLRAAPRTIRLFLSAGMASVSAMRSTMKLPARDQEAVQATSSSSASR